MGETQEDNDNIASYLRNAEHKQQSERSEGRAMVKAVPSRLQSIVVDRRRRDPPLDSRNNGHKINNTSIPAGGNKSWKNECRVCGFSHQLVDCRNVTPSKRQFPPDRFERPSRFSNRNRPFPFNNDGRNAPQQINNTRGNIQGGGCGAARDCAGIRLFPGTCHTCKQPGHIGKNCPNTRPQEHQANVAIGGAEHGAGYAVDLNILDVASFQDGHPHEAHAALDGDILTSPNPS